MVKAGPGICCGVEHTCLYHHACLVHWASCKVKFPSGRVTKIMRDAETKCFHCPACPKSYQNPKSLQTHTLKWCARARQGYEPTFVLNEKNFVSSIPSNALEFPSTLTQKEAPKSGRDENDGHAIMIQSNPISQIPFSSVVPFIPSQGSSQPLNISTPTGPAGHNPGIDLTLLHPPRTHGSLPLPFTSAQPVAVPLPELAAISPDHTPHMTPGIPLADPVFTFLQGLKRPLGHLHAVLVTFGIRTAEDLDMLSMMESEWDDVQEFLAKEIQDVTLLEWLILKRGLKARASELSSS